MDAVKIFSLMKDIAMVAARYKLQGRTEEEVEQVAIAMLHRSTEDVLACALALMTDAEDGYWFVQQHDEFPLGSWALEGAAAEVAWRLGGRFEAPIKVVTGEV